MWANQWHMAGKIPDTCKLKFYNFPQKYEKQKADGNISNTALISNVLSKLLQMRQDQE